MKGPFLTVPNLISLARVPLSLGAGLALLAGRDLLTALLVSAAILSDWLDGAVARATGRTGDWGRVLDPMADKVGFAVFGVCLAVVGSIPWWAIAAVLAREAVVAAGGLALAHRLSRPPSSNAAGKLSTVLLSAWMARQAISPAAAGADWLMWLALASLLVSTVSYASRALRGSANEGRACCA